MTEENIRFESDSDEAVSTPVPQTESTEGATASPKTEITPLIPGTEIIGRRARRAAMMKESEDPTPASVEEPSPAEIPVFAQDATVVQARIPAEEAAEESVAAPVEPVEAVSDPLAELFSDREEVHLRRVRSAEAQAPVPGEEDDFTPVDQIPRRRARVAPEPAVKKKPCVVSPFVELVEIVVGALVAAILVLTLVCRTGVVEGASMVPTMYEGDRYVISDLFYTPEQGDIVVFRPEIDGEDELWIKRVIALEGQTVYIDPNTYQVYVDGKLLDEPYLGGAGTIPHTTENPVTVPEGCVYVLGDNRAISHDSRYEDLGCVEIGQLAGRVILRFWPIENFGFCE